MDAVGEVLKSVVASERSGFAGKKVLVKPNLLSAKGPARGITTHPSVVGAVIDYFKDLGAHVSVGDSPAGAIRGVKRVWEETGMSAICRSKQVDLVNFEAGGWVSRSVDGRSYEIARAVYEFEYVINLPKLKTHILTLMTASIKNVFGCVPGFRKSALHLVNPDPKAMSKALVDVFSLVRPWVTLVDAVDAMEGKGPSSGRLRRLGLVAASRDPVALDTLLAKIIGLDPGRVPTTKEAARRGLGESRVDSIEIDGPDLEQFSDQPFDLPAHWKFFLIPAFIGKALARLVWIKPLVNAEVCTGCGDCVAICAAGAIALDSDNAAVDHDRCTSCLCCHEACSQGAIDVRMSRLARFLA
jgi:uncharacterized protein (DUF362 family)/ferredoxin